MKKTIIVIFIAIIIILTIILGGVYFLFNAQYNSKGRPKTLNVSNTVFSTENIENIPSELSVSDAVKSDYFVYDGLENKVYNKNTLNRFISNTQINAENRISDEIIIVVYTANGELIIYNLCYNADINKYFYAYDYTRIKTWEISDEEILKQEMYNKIITNDNILGQYYGIEVIEDTDFDVAIIVLKAYSNNENYEDIEIARYMLDVK